MTKYLSGEMHSMTPDDICTPADGVIASLCFLYQEALRSNLTQLSTIIQEAIEQSALLTSEPKLQITHNGLDQLKQFYVLREFQKLDDLKKQILIREMDSLCANSTQEENR